MEEHAFTLKTSMFNSSERQPHFINDRCFGEDFARWLRSRLITSEVAVSEPIQEDWGWCLVVNEGGKKFTLAIGIMDDSIGAAPAEWRVGIAYERAMNGVAGLIGAVPSGTLDSLAARLRDILAQEPSFSEVEECK